MGLRPPGTSAPLKNLASFGASAEVLRERLAAGNDDGFPTKLVVKHACGARSPSLSSRAVPTNTYLIFSQQRDLVPDELALARTAQTVAHASLAIVERSFAGHDAAANGQLRIDLRGSNDTAATSFQVGVRFSTSTDYEAAERAEIAGRAAGMAMLAKRCPVVWEVNAEHHTETAVLGLCAILASVLLGPILPPDESTLMGVRSARLRADKLRQRQ